MSSLSVLSVRFHLLERAREELAHTAYQTKAAPMKSLPTGPRIITNHKDAIYVHQQLATTKNKKKKKTKNTKPARDADDWEEEDFGPPVHRRVKSGEMAYRFAPYLPSSLRKTVDTQRRADRVVIHERRGEWRQRLDHEIDEYMEEGREARERMEEQFEALRKLYSGTEGNNSPCPELIEM
ncbi:hypothetical protein HDU87_001820 [Geranomyces variabilis]|uniref:Uncharacterized protein n=1 Tax=Geranomyces variabilis TaxID=109894 RepID=A0AAD5XSF9_9FUNG|nr:hypothetical protein HDU87_001820 [Geranomyces variabilis]